MAKSLRSKPKLRAKSLKRKGEFSKASDERSARLASKLKANLEKQNEEKADDEKMDEEPKKVSTSGWRGTSRQRMKQKRNKKNSTKF